MAPGVWLGCWLGPLPLAAALAYLRKFPKSRSAWSIIVVALRKRLDIIGGRRRDQ
jgi:hypothetical protein